MTSPIDEQIWTGLQRRLSAVEGYIAEPAPWRAADERVSKVGVRVVGGGAFGRRAPARRGARSGPMLVLLVLLVVAALVGALVVVGLVGRQAPRPALEHGFNPTGTMIRMRSNAAAVSLLDGRAVLIGGDLRSPTAPDLPPSSTAELYDPLTRAFEPGGSLPPAVQLTTYSSATMLLDGRVLIVDGFDATAALWDPATGTFEQVDSLSGPRSYAAAALLHDGRVLVAGGEASRPAGPALATAEVFDPATGRWSPTGSMSIARGGPTAMTLADGRVLVMSDDGDTPSTEIYDPGSGAFTPAGSTAGERYQYATAMLADGRVLIAGGWRSSVEPGPDVLLGSVELFDPAKGRSVPAGNLVVPRRLAKATPLLDGRVLITGGDQYPSPDTADLPSELFDPSTMRFERVPDSPVAMDATVTRLRDGDVLIADGSVNGEGAASARLFHP